ncbi:hypothetical protein GCM10023185_13160 [Hymenobacter saemangeumensis]|uniref:DUF4476 domain-containing protein n=1 Tax=Hymenobacter saemangeumensis TaxID=1084522 RepID=A0ABP8I7R8_9BACT
MNLTTIFANKPLQITLVVVGLVVAIYWYGKKAGDDKKKFDPELPNSGSGIPQGWDPMPRVRRLHEVMAGVFTPSLSKEAEWRMNLALTNDQLTAVYGAFNRAYCTSNDETLTTWIDDEFGAPFNSAKPALLNRLRSLNLN